MTILFIMCHLLPVLIIFNFDFRVKIHFQLFQKQNLTVFYNYFLSVLKLRYNDYINKVIVEFKFTNWM
ncbi:hypothetical protein BK821_11900 [Staphylococcus sp. LCT-H4]|nr:hypothetical protein BK821_11900 [Staphylococcus sp. LCT-H4]